MGHHKIVKAAINGFDIIVFVLLSLWSTILYALHARKRMTDHVNCRHSTIKVLLFCQAILEFGVVGVLLIMTLTRLLKSRETTNEQQKQRFYNLLVVYKFFNFVLGVAVAGVLGSALGIVIHDYRGCQLYSRDVIYGPIIVIAVHVGWMLSRMLMVYCLNVCLQPSYPPTKQDNPSERRNLLSPSFEEENVEI
ncbi:ZSWIM3 [Acrasis kona]|uniref:ZSWIM3 n=1 Tax=Acrasis kona TaxID=1008807 RepID=A0AAW2YIL9_9EUKA